MSFPFRRTYSWRRCLKTGHDFDERMMSEALRLARKGEGCVSPNPLIGAVIVKNGEIVGRGYHRRIGGPHAEVVALEQAGRSCEPFNPVRQSGTVLPSGPDSSLH